MQRSIPFQSPHTENFMNTELSQLMSFVAPINSRLRYLYSEAKAFAIVYNKAIRKKDSMYCDVEGGEALKPAKVIVQGTVRSFRVLWVLIVACKDDPLRIARDTLRESLSGRCSLADVSNWCPAGFAKLAIDVELKAARVRKEVKSLVALRRQIRRAPAKVNSMTPSKMNRMIHRLKTAAEKQLQEVSLESDLP
jgi:hypothetical protein